MYGANTVHTYVSGKTIPVENVPGMGGGIKENDGGSELKYNMFDIL
jgi:hypothetical protein